MMLYFLKYLLPILPNSCSVPDKSRWTDLLLMLLHVRLKLSWAPVLKCISSRLVSIVIIIAYYNSLLFKYQFQLLPVGPKGIGRRHLFWLLFQHGLTQ